VRSWSEIVVDKPLCLKVGNVQWYRIRSLGAADIPGGRVVTGDRSDNALRKFSLVSNRRTGKPVAGPQSTRMIEAIAKPVKAFGLALFGIDGIDLKNQNVVVDSYDSTDPTKSTNGKYDPTKKQENGDIATNGQVIDAGGAYIHGEAMTGQGGEVLDKEHVSGTISDDFYQSVYAVHRPDILPDAGTPTIVNGSNIFVASASKPSRYQISALYLSGKQVLHLQGAVDGSPTYIQIVVTGDVRVSGGDASIQIDPGVYVRIFVEGNVDITGGGFINPNPPINLQMYGVDPAGDFPNHIKIAGNGGFSGAIYAPKFDVSLTGGGTDDSVYGSFVGKTVTMTGVQSVHYDEALVRAGLITDYKIVSWFEDER
jgi:hypothetical protein